MTLLCGCSHQNRNQVWYIVSDQYGSLVVYNNEEKFLLIASITLSDLVTYRGKLLKENIESDNLGALQSLFNLPFNYLLEGTKDDWKTLYNNKTYTYHERINYIMEGEDDLSKIINTGTLESLVGKQTTVSDIKKLYETINNESYVLRVYNVSQFFQPLGDTTLNRKLIGEWTKRALEEAGNK